MRKTCISCKENINEHTPVVGGVPDAEVVAAHRGKPLHPVAGVQAHCLNCCVVASIPVFALLLLQIQYGVTGFVLSLVENIIKPVVPDPI